VDLDLYCTQAAPSQIAPIARAAEQAGFSGAWFTESSHNPYIACALASAATSSIMIGTDIAVAFPRSPMVTAQAAWDLAQLSGGRFVLGLGTQVKAHVERRFSVPFSRPAARLRDYVLALRAIFAAFQGTAPLRYESEFYSFSLLTEFFSGGPIEHPDIPIYVAGVSTAMATLAGEACDGFCAHPLHSVRYLTDVVAPAISTGAARAGRDTASVTMAVPVFVIVGDTEGERERRRRAVRRQIAFYGSTRTYQRVLDIHGWGDLSGELHSAMAKGDLDGMEAMITDEMLDVYAVTATWDDLGPSLIERYRGVASRILPYDTARDLASPDTAARWSAVAAQVRNLR
jgi:probable F420-dependent oxidoreductase